MGCSFHYILWIFFRLGELLLSNEKEFNLKTCLAWGDVAIDNGSEPTMIQVHLKWSKYDQFGKGADIILGCTDSKVCPVLAFLNFVDMRKKFPVGPFFLNTAGKPVTKSWFTSRIRDSLRSIGLP